MIGQTRGDDDWLTDTRASYDTVAADYAELPRGLLDETVAREYRQRT